MATKKVRLDGGDRWEKVRDCPRCGKWIKSNGWDSHIVERHPSSPEAKLRLAFLANSLSSCRPAATQSPPTTARSASRSDQRRPADPRSCVGHRLTGRPWRFWCAPGPAH